MREELSTRFTFLQKFILPGVMLVVCVAGTGARVVAGQEVETFFLLTGVLFLAFFLTGFRLKRVRLANDGLLVSNYSDEVLIEYSEIANVFENKWGRNRTITLDLKSPGRFGTQIVFLPYSHLTWFWMDHPVATFLRTKIGG
jgi:hypothetical protein